MDYFLKICIFRQNSFVRLSHFDLLGMSLYSVERPGLVLHMKSSEGLDQSLSLRHPASLFQVLHFEFFSRHTCTLFTIAYR